MAVGKLQKAWTVTANERQAYTSLLDVMGWWAYRNKVALLAAGWTMKWSCDGATGPANAGDATDRIASAANFATRATIAAAAQSYFVVYNADGLQLLITYQGASDDICRVSYSEGGNFTLAGTTTQQPTASDEMVLSTGNSVINATTSADRVMTTWCTNRSWSNALYRSNALQQYMGVDEYDSAIPSAIKTWPYYCYRYLTFTNTINNADGPCSRMSSTTFGSAGFQGGAVRHTYGGSARVSKLATPMIFVQSSGTNPSVTLFPISDQPAMQNGVAMPFLPLILIGENSANLDGFAGVAIDWYLGYATSGKPVVGDFFPGLDNTDNVGDSPRTAWWVALGPYCIRPWRNASASLQTA